MTEQHGNPFREVLLLLALAGLFGLASWGIHPRAPSWADRSGEEGSVDLAAVRNYPADLLFADARALSEFEAGHIPGAVWVSEDDFETGLLTLLESWRPDMGIVVYCGGGECQASKAVANRLREALGTDEIYWLEGGIEAWKSELE